MSAIDERNMKEQLETVIAWKKRSTGLADFNKIWLICHDLAEAQYQPALSFFLEGLGDLDWNWRDTCLKLLGFHYNFPPDGVIIDKVRELLRMDPDDRVRMTSANVLGVASTLPDQTLVNALTSDPDWFVRISAYFALLKLAGISYEVYLREDERFDFETEEPEPLLQDLKLVLIENGFAYLLNKLEISTE